jgi:hypothetical protein
MRKLLTLLLIVLVAGCGGGGSPAPPGGGGLGTAQSYFPLTLGVTYVYKVITLIDPFDWDNTDDTTLVTTANPQGDGVWFKITSNDQAGPVFNGLAFVGTQADFGWQLTNQGGTGASILPATLSTGATWTGSMFLGNPGDPFLNVGANFTLTGTETITVQGQTYADCVKVVATSTQSGGFGTVSPLETTYWLAKNVGVVRASVKYLGVVTAVIELSSRT